MAPEGRNAVKARDPLVRKLSHALVMAVLTSSLLMAIVPAKAVGQSGSNVTQVIRQADDSENVQFVLTLPLQNQTELNQLLKSVYNPHSPNYRHFLSSAEFKSKYAPSDAAYAALESFAKKSGLTVTGEHTGHTLLDVSGNAATIRNNFKTQMYWRQTNEGKQYLASDVEPTAPSELSSLGGNVAGLNQRPLKAFAQPTGGNPPTGTGSGPSGLFVPYDIKTAYNLNGIQNGGEPVALVEFSSANYSDAAVYASWFGLNNPTLTQISVDGGTTDESNADEVMLDIEMVMSVSNATNIYIYTAPNTTTGALNLYAQIAEDNLVGQVSISWGGCEANLEPGAANQQNTAFSQMAAEGIAVFASSGDYADVGCPGGQGLGVVDPASQPYVTGVGGTSLTTAKSSQTYVSESTWLTLPTGSGGGISSLWPIPAYQTGVTPQSSQFSTTMRNVPDVALNANPNTGYYIYCSICGSNKTAGWAGYGGTSAAAPQWAALWSLIGKGLTPSSGSPARAGFANPTIYAIGENSNQYAQNFHDVTTGTNAYYNAVAGYDNVTGWGSFNGGNLYQAVIARKRTSTIAPIISYLLLRNTGN